MALKIRLARGGAKKRPFYRSSSRIRAARATAASSRRSAPTTRCSRRATPSASREDERIKHWLDSGALPSDRVARFLGDAGLVPKPEIRDDAARNRRPRPRRKSAPRPPPKRAGAAAPSA